MWGIKRETALLVIVAVLFAAIQIVFFPQFYSSSDENHFLSNSLQIQRGYLGEENPEKVCSASAFGENGYISGQYIGRSLFLVPFTWFSPVKPRLARSHSQKIENKGNFCIALPVLPSNILAGPNTVCWHLGFDFFPCCVLFLYFEKRKALCASRGLIWIGYACKI